MSRSHLGENLCAGTLQLAADSICPGLVTSQTACQTRPSLQFVSGFHRGCLATKQKIDYWFIFVQISSTSTHLWAGKWEFGGTSMPNDRSGWLLSASCSHLWRIPSANVPNYRWKWSKFSPSLWEISNLQSVTHPSQMTNLGSGKSFWALLMAE